MGEVVVQRDEENRIVTLTARGMEEATGIGSRALHALRAAGVAMTDYLHLAPDLSEGEEVRLVVDRSDPYLYREIDAIMETLVIDLKLLSREQPGDLVVHEEAVGIEV